MKIKAWLVGFVLLIGTVARADEGMWLPMLLEKLNEKQMRSMGMKITAKDIYNINGSSLKDAIVSFGGFCTGEVISSKGLLLTNHHCGFDAIQNHSTLDNNYIRDGFWAKTNAAEIPNPGLFVTFIVRMEDVTAKALAGVDKGMSESARQSAIDKNINQLRTSAKKESYQSTLVRAMFEGNQYFLFVTETYNDVRLVGAPPSAIGNFGKDTDNWMWPRHTGDFSMFRIYAGKDNKPAAYSPDNVPYIPKKSLSISMDGVAENDFTMVFGFPGRTQEYLHSSAVEQIVNVNNPIKIAIRTSALGVIDGFMRNDESVKIKYAAKYASISNAWKKWQGEILGLTRTNAIDKKKSYEAELRKRIAGNPAWTTQYGTILGDLQAAYDEIRPYGLARDVYTETVSRIELFSVGFLLNTLVSAHQRNGERGYNERLPIVKNSLEALFAELDPQVDQKLFEALISMYAKDQPADRVSPMFKKILDESKGDYTVMSTRFYKANMLTSRDAVMELLGRKMEETLAVIRQSELVRLGVDMNEHYVAGVQGKLNEVQGRINKLQRTYMQAQMDIMKEKTFYPDANSTLRVTYGKVKGYEARDAVKYDFYTYLDGVMDKYVPGDYEFDVPAKLRDLHQKKDYGKYGKGGKMPVCFIGANHTTGGNSGSPALDAQGNLIGLNFDRVWEGTMSDINYDPSICRNIMVDIRYVLFIVDKYAGAGHLVDEMKLVYPKSRK